MRIPFKRIDNKTIVEAQVEVPDSILNHFAICETISENLNEGFIDIPHVRPEAFTKVFGDAAMSFQEKKEQRPSTEHTQKQLCSTEAEYVLLKLGFKYKAVGRWWHPLFGEDFEHNWMWFDSITDDLLDVMLKFSRLTMYKVCNHVL